MSGNSSSLCFYDCSDDGLANATFYAYPDISGIGATVGFTGTAYITETIFIVFYIVSFEPATTGKPNPIDLGFLTAFRRVLKKLYRSLSSKEWVTPDNVRSQEWQQALNQCVLTLSDLQILTGIGNPCWIFSDALSANGVSGVYAVCFFKALAFAKEEHLSPLLSGPDLGASMVISITILSVSFIAKVVKMHDTASLWVMRRTRTFFGNRYKSMLKILRNRAQLSTVKRNERTTSSLKVGLKVGLCWILFSILMIGYRLALAVFLIVRAVLDLCDSMLWEILWLIFGIGWGSVHLLEFRAAIVEAADNNWTFGQGFPVLLLASPLVSIWELVYDAWHRKK